MNLKKLAAAVLSCTMLLGAAAYSPYNCTLFTDTPLTASATDKTADEAIAWAKSQVNKSIDMDGFPTDQPYQCVDLIKAYYKYLGVPVISGNGKDFATNDLPDSSWKRIQGAVPQKGDILVYGASNSNPYGHVAIYESDYSTYHQNVSGAYVENITTIKFNGFTNPYWGVIRPNFSSRITGTPMTAGAGKTIPDGDYWINCTVDPHIYVDPAPGNDIPAEKSANVATWDYGSGMPPVADVWTIKYLNNGYYQITQKGTNMSLDVTGGEMYSETNLQMYPLWGDDNVAQQWSIKKVENGYSIQSRCNSFYVDAAGGKPEPANIWLWVANGTAAQTFKFIPYEAPVTTTTTTTTTSTTSTTTATTTTTTQQELKIDETEITIAVGEQYTIKANQSDLTYESNDKDIATVSKSGVITAKKAGNAVIFISNKDEDTAVLKVTVVSEKPKAKKYGDANLDDNVSVADAVAIMQFLGNKDKYDLSAEAKANADCFNTGDGITGNDALTIQKVDAGLIKLEDLPIKN